MLFIDTMSLCDSKNVPFLDSVARCLVSGAMVASIAIFRSKWGGSDIQEREMRVRFCFFGSVADEEKRLI